MNLFIYLYLSFTTFSRLYYIGFTTCHIRRTRCMLFTADGYPIFTQLQCPISLLHYCCHGVFKLCTDVDNGLYCRFHQQGLSPSRFTHKNRPLRSRGGRNLYKFGLNPIYSHYLSIRRQLNSKHFSTVFESFFFCVSRCI